MLTKLLNKSKKIINRLFLNNSADKKSNENISNLLHEFKITAEMAPVGVYQLTNDGTCIYANHYWYELLNLSPKHVIGRSWFDLIHPEDKEHVKEKWETCTRSGAHFNGEFRIQGHSQKIHWVTCDAVPLPLKTSDTFVYLAVSANITSRHKHEKNLSYLAHFDPLTGLANRAYFQEKLKDAIQRNIRANKYLVLFFLDLDGFKFINDSLGHDAGDLLLKQVGKRLKDSIRKTDTVARLGGDEFTILLENVNDPSRISVSAKKINDLLEKSFHIKGQEVFVTSSMGIAICSKESTVNHQTLLKQADIAMYRAKDKGKNTFQYFTDELNTEIHRKMAIGNKLHYALELNELSIHYQPQVDMTTKKIIATEALLRWTNSEFGVIRPDEFIPIAEDNGLIIPISKWLIIETCQQLVQWQKLNIPLNNIHISINLSPKHFSDASLIPFIQKTFDQTKIDPSKVVFEITEGILIGNHQETKNILLELKNFGSMIALDDFGTGYSSLSYLKQFPIDILKIDQSFVQQVLTEPEEQSIVTAIIALSNSLNLQVIAEGVETKGMADFLIANKCSIGQGYYYSRPQSAEELEKWAKGWKV